MADHERPKPTEIVIGLRDAFLKFIDELIDPSDGRELWFGRERDAVSLFAFGALQEVLIAKKLITNTRQISIESGCTQLPDPKSPGKRTKKIVCKDLVIWPAGVSSVWQSRKDTRPELPLAVIEWKFSGSALGRKVSRPELAREQDWLMRYAKQHRESSVAANAAISISESEAKFDLRFHGGFEKENQSVRRPIRKKDE